MDTPNIITLQQWHEALTARQQGHVEVADLFDLALRGELLVQDETGNYFQPRHSEGQDWELVESQPPQDVTEGAGSADQATTDRDNPGGDSAAKEAGGSSPSVAHYKEQLEAARAEVADLRDQALRSQAELQNARRRMQRERDEERQFAALPITRDVLPVMDNLRRAIEAAQQSGNIEELLTGIEMVYRQLEDAMSRHAVKPIAAEGQSFDPNLHEAISQVPTSEQPPMTLLQEVERGYTIHDRVIRPSKVIVSVAPQE